jgi:DNA oxidative demethylase
VVCNPPVRPRSFPTTGNLFVPDYLSIPDREALEAWLAALLPLWEERYSLRRGPPPGETQRRLLRPVYWLGNWQFACLGYYEPPKRVLDCAVAAEPFPPFLRAWVDDIEARAHRAFAPGQVPRGWHLNTCLVNFYGSRREGPRWVDAARVGEHRDFEPGPVASLSIGERARFQFVRRGAGPEAPPVQTVWLTDRSLQLFAGPFWKEQVLHRVQRVEDKERLDLPPSIADFRTRRVNLTFRYVPDAHIVPYRALSADAQADVRPYVEALAEGAEFWRLALGP